MFVFQSTERKQNIDILLQVQLVKIRGRGENGWDQ